MTTYRHLNVLVEPDPDAVRVETVRGDDHLVAPVVAVAEGVLNGGFLPFEEIAKSAAGWNGVPVTANHPTDESGEFIPANQPEVLKKYQIGRFLNVEADPDGKKLDGEMWINLAVVAWLVEKADELGDIAKATVQKVKNGDALEVSTGYFHRFQRQSGEYQAEEYEEVQQDLLPDHLAALPNSEGACNWEGDTTASGCGAPRTQSSSDAVAANGGGFAFAANCDDCSGGFCECDGGEDDSIAQRVGDAVRNALSGNTDPTAGESFALHGADCGCEHCTMDNGYDDDRLERIASQSAFEVDELRDMSENAVDKIEETLESNDSNDDSGDEPTANSGDGDGDGGQTLADMSVDDFREEVADVAADIVEAKNKKSEREELVDEITTLSSFERDELPEDVEKLRSMRSKLDAQTSTTPDFGGRAATSPGSDGDVDGVQIGGAMTAQEEVEELIDGS